MEEEEFKKTENENPGPNVLPQINHKPKNQFFNIDEFNSDGKDQDEHNSNVIDHANPPSGYTPVMNSKSITKINETGKVKEIDDLTHHKEKGKVDFDHKSLSKISETK
uniref:Uncharacterized protein n=1 Tax=Euplotes harpa TaxID=151035 RepID=A0A7S3JD81_9SPIT|mmetsp:Transcript_33575/g.38593  ORF Transcript_33575/g.38593 Transcript_33575/m.38593 type:complete len:108 (+) Transcript_33575:24-347(+)